MILRAGTIKRIHVDQHVIRANRKNGTSRVNIGVTMYTVEHINWAGDLVSRTFVRRQTALLWLEAMTAQYGAASLLEHV